MTRAQTQKLLRSARAATRNSYSPFSRFPVGAAVLCAGGRVFAGANVENSSYGLTVCAERIAIFNAVASGYRRIAAVAVYADTPGLTPPCGACLQVIAEFSDNPGILIANRTRHEILRLSDLLPRAFHLKK